jgi:hypothetical protein
MLFNKKLILVLALQPILAVVVFSLTYFINEKTESLKTIRVVKPKPPVETIKTIEPVDWDDTTLTSNKKQYLEYLYKQE